jgi:sugar phosphate permease
MTSRLAAKKQTPAVKPVDNHDKKLIYHQRLTFGVLYLGFVAFTAAKRSLSFTGAAAIEAGDLTKPEVGALASILSSTFAVSKFFGGVLCDRFNPIFLMASGLVVCSLANIVFAWSSSWTLFASMWFLNGLCQSPSWPPVALLMTRWYSHEDRPSWWAVRNQSPSVE